jgi:hypothetical protein
VNFDSSSTAAFAVVSLMKGGSDVEGDAVPVDPERVQAIFLEAVERRSAAERAAVLDRLCGSDAELRERVDALLQAHDSPGAILLSPPPDPVATADEPPIAERPGTSIGTYKFLEQIGEGGFGVVFMAEQTRPLPRKVALKVLKPGMDTRHVVVRSEAERQALAIMDHPNIAKVFDGGATPSVRPYFVMELVKGVPVTEYCDQNQLTPRQRLELFVPVCQAVQHAHQKGIIHRDLKPSNILVTTHDVTPVPKIIDFGVAKALGQELTDKTLFTGFAQLVGTPLYMSPEQAGQSGLDVDTRSDVYSLDGRRIASAGWDKTIKIWDAETGKETLTLRGHALDVHKVAFSPDGQLLVSAGQDDVKVWDATPVGAIAGPKLSEFPDTRVLSRVSPSVPTDDYWHRPARTE